MAAKSKYPEPLVFGLDIGTRSIVGTVGYQEGDQFNIVAQAVKFHDTRAMLDGQIHDINKVGEEIIYVKEQLEKQLPGKKLKEVCIAAAGRVLKTSVGHAYCEFQENTVVTQEYVHSLEMLGVEKAHELMMQDNHSGVKFFCVGFSVITYYLNEFEITNLEGHKARSIGADVLATFLPEEVVDGLYAAVSMADLEIANMTLEPIAAIHVAIPEKYRLLNIALVDVGAGTSDICITKDGTIIGYGMLPHAGDEITEALVQSYLVDFAIAENLKTTSLRKKSVSYKDIMGVSHKVTPQEIMDEVQPVVDDIAMKTAEKIKELNGGKSVSAVFIVGGGGKIQGYTQKLAEHLALSEDRVALRGEEVLGFVNIFVEGVKKDPLLVTPIGICLNFYDQKNHFIFLQVNEERVKLYNNDKLTVLDAALAYGLANEDVFPKRGKVLNYTLNGKQKFQRGIMGEPAVIRLNGVDVGMAEPVTAGDVLEIEPSSKGVDARLQLKDLPDFSTTISFEVNDVTIRCPRSATVNDEIKPEIYEIHEGDRIELRNYYTLAQLLQYMDIDTPHDIFVNGARATADTKIYENFKVAWIENEENYKAERFVEEEYDEYADEYEEDISDVEDRNTVQVTSSYTSMDAFADKEWMKELKTFDPDAFKQKKEMEQKSTSFSAFSDSRQQTNVSQDTLNSQMGNASQSGGFSQNSYGQIGNISQPGGFSQNSYGQMGNVPQPGGLSQNGYGQMGNAPQPSGFSQNGYGQMGNAPQLGGFSQNGYGQMGNTPQLGGFSQNSYGQMGNVPQPGEMTQNTYSQMASSSQTSHFDQSEVDEKNISTKPVHSVSQPINTTDDMQVIVNGKIVTLSGKKEYIFVDIFDKIDFDLKTIGGSRLVQAINGVNTDYFEPIHAGDVIEIYWEP